MYYQISLTGKALARLGLFAGAVFTQPGFNPLNGEGARTPCPVQHIHLTVFLFQSP